MNVPCCCCNPGFFCRQVQLSGVCPSRYLYMRSAAYSLDCIQMLPASFRVHRFLGGRAWPRYNKTLLNCFPGNCRTILFISKLKSVARTSLEFKPLVSTIASMCLDSSALKSSQVFFSDALRPSAASRFRCSASTVSACSKTALTDVSGGLQSPLPHRSPVLLLA